MDTMDALFDLRERIINAEAQLRVEAQKHPYGSSEQARLNAKADGVALVRDYIRHTLGIVEAAAR